MSENRSGIFVARPGDDLFVQVSGRGNYRNAPPLRQLGLEAIDQGCKTVRVDLAECQGMDSTFLGVLAGFGLRMRQLSGPLALHLFNAGEHGLRLCHSLGLDRLALLEAGPPSRQDFQVPQASDFRKLPGTDLTTPCAPDREETALLMLDAHEDLCEADDRNEAKFKDVKRFLREEIARQSVQPKKPE